MIPPDGWTLNKVTDTYHHTDGRWITEEMVRRSGFPPDPNPERVAFEGGGIREPQDGKPRYDLFLPLDVPMEHQFLTRIARHLGQSLNKYPERNWEQFSDLEAMDRARASAFRHFIAWMTGDQSEDVDHAAAVVFNLMAAEHVAAKLEGKIK